MLFRQRLYQHDAEGLAQVLAEVWRSGESAKLPSAVADARPTATVPSPAVARRLVGDMLHSLDRAGIRLAGEDAAERLSSVPSSGSRERQMESAAARLALAGAVGRLCRDNPTTAIWVSMSHTTGVGAAIAAASTLEHPIVGVGIDVERHDREVSDRVMARIAHPGDDWSEAPAVVRWCIKEACFKADPEADGSFSRYRIESKPCDGRQGLWTVAARFPGVAAQGLAGISSGYAYATVVAEPD